MFPSCPLHLSTFSPYLTTIPSIVTAPPGERYNATYNSPEGSHGEGSPPSHLSNGRPATPLNTPFLRSRATDGKKSLKRPSLRRPKTKPSFAAVPPRPGGRAAKTRGPSWATMQLHFEQTAPEAALEIEHAFPEAYGDGGEAAVRGRNGPDGQPPAGSCCCCLRQYHGPTPTTQLTKNDARYSNHGTSSLLHVIFNRHRFPPNAPSTNLANETAA